MEILEEVETVPKTEISVSGENQSSEVLSQSVVADSPHKSEAETQPSHPTTAAHSNFTQMPAERHSMSVNTV